MNQKTLSSFVSYCEAHPEQRFWQALRNWANEYYGGVERRSIYRARTSGWGGDEMQDTFEMD